MLLLYRHLVQTFQFGYSSSLYTGFWCTLSFQFGLQASVVFIQTFGTDFPVWLQFQFVYRLLVQTFQFGYRQCCFYIDIWNRLSSLAIVLVCILAFVIDFLSSLAIGQLLLYRHLVQTFQFGYSSSLYTGFWYILSSLVIGNVAFIQKFGTVFLVLLQFQFVCWLLIQTFQFGYRLCCFYIDLWYRLSSLAIVIVCIQAFGIDFPIWIQTMFIIQKFGTGFPVRIQFQFVYWLLVQTFQFGYRLFFLNIDIMYRLSSSDIVLVCILAFVIDFLSRLAIDYVAFIQTFGTNIPVWLQFQFVYWLLVYTFFPV